MRKSRYISVFLEVSRCQMRIARGKSTEVLMCPQGGCLDLLLTAFLFGIWLRQHSLRRSMIVQFSVEQSRRVSYNEAAIEQGNLWIILCSLAPLGVRTIHISYTPGCNGRYRRNNRFVRYRDITAKSRHRHKTRKCRNVKSCRAMARITEAELTD